jgi:hypothetical protein
MSTKHLLALLAVATPLWCQPSLVVAGLQSPMKIVLTPGGNLLVSEASMNPNAGRISVVGRTGSRRTLIGGLPSGTEVVGGPAGPSAMALRDRTLFVALGTGDSERRGQTPGTSIPNPAGPSSPIFASILRIRFSNDVDQTFDTFELTPDHQRTLTDGGEVELGRQGSSTARISVLARFPITEPEAGILYRFSNPWGMALDGRWLYVTDASMNSLARVDTVTGRWQRIVRFPQVQNPTPVGPPKVDAVPTSIRIFGDEVLISFLTGFPFVPGNARVLAVNPETGASRTFISGVTSATDVLWRPVSRFQSEILVLEFSQNQSANPAPPGRLLRYNSPEPQVLVPNLITPVSMAYDAERQDLFILELRGQILRLHLD